MERDLGKEIDALKEQMEELMKIMARQGNGKKPTSPEDRVEVMDHMHPDPHLKELMSRLCEETKDVYKRQAIKRASRAFW